MHMLCESTSLWAPPGSQPTSYCVSSWWITLATDWIEDGVRFTLALVTLALDILCLEHSILEGAIQTTGSHFHGQEHSWTALLAI